MILKGLQALYLVRHPFAADLVDRPIQAGAGNLVQEAISGVPRIPSALCVLKKALGRIRGHERDA
jgi:hypothetical protein